MMLQDLYAGKRVFTNIALKNVPKKLMDNVTYLNKELIVNIFEKVKNKEFNLLNSTIFIQEAHNYVDSRNSASKKNKIFSYFILQSRHTGEGSCDIIYDTQELSQVDLRLRRNTDYVLRPTITYWDYSKGKRKPAQITVIGNAKIGHKWVNFSQQYDVTTSRNQYDTHQLVDFEI